MALTYRVLDGLPPYGPMAVAIPAGWGGGGQEGFVVHFGEGSDAWTGNFKPGMGGFTGVILHPNRNDLLVFASGSCWVVDSSRRVTEWEVPAIESVIQVPGEQDFIFNRQGLALVRIGSTGLIWHTRRLSWDGLEDLEFHGERLQGNAWSPMDNSWHPFEVNITTGASTGGSYYGPALDGWERLSRD